MEKSTVRHVVNIQKNKTRTVKHEPKTYTKVQQVFSSDGGDGQQSQNDRRFDETHLSVDLFSVFLFLDRWI